MRMKGYKGLEVYNTSKKLVVACYELTHDLPEEERTNLTHCIRSAALKVHINVAQGAFLRKVKRRKKFIRNAQSALIVIDAATEVLVEVGFAKPDQLNELLQLSSACYQLLGELKKK
jgi:four helix bundle protein